MPRKDNLADLVAADMASIMDSEEHKSVFSKPVVVKEASAKQSDTKSEKYKLVVEGIAKIAEVLDDELDLPKSAIATLKALNTIVSEAAGDDEEESEELEHHALEDLEKAQELEGDKDDADDKKDPTKRELPPYHPGVPNPKPVPGGGNTKPQLPGGASRKTPDNLPAPSADDGQAADDLDTHESDVHGAYKSTIDLGVKDDSGMADDGATTASVDLQQLLQSLGGDLTKSAEKARGDFVFPKGSSKVKDNKDHFPINTEGRARNALARANQYSKAPPWYTGSLQSLVTAVANAVKRKYKGIDVSKDSRVPGPGGGKKKKKSWHDYLDNQLIVEALSYGDYDVPNFDEDYAEMYEDLRSMAAQRNDQTLVALAEKEKGSYIFPSSHPHVKSGDHFPINTEGRARNALARANQYSKAPKWWTGSLQSLVSAVARAVHSKYKGIEVSKKSKKPGKG